MFHKHNLVFSLLAAAAFLLSCSGCYKVATDTTGLEASKGPWTVDGIRLGMSREECIHILGEPRPPLPFEKKNILAWAKPRDVIVTFNDNDEAVDIYGHNLTDLSGKVVVWSSASEEEVRAILKSARKKKYYRPKGSGVISIGMKHCGTDYTVSDGKGSYCVSFYEERMSCIRAMKEGKKEKRF